VAVAHATATAPSLVTTETIITTGADVILIEEGLTVEIEQDNCSGEWSAVAYRGSRKEIRWSVYGGGRLLDVLRMATQAELDIEEGCHGDRG